MSAPGGGADLTIDLHTHILPHGWPDLEQLYGCPGWLHLEKEGPDSARLMRGNACFRQIDARCWEAERRLADCDASGVHVQVLSTVPVMFSYWAPAEHALDLSRRLNDHIAEVVARHPRRFVGLGTLPLQDPDRAIGELQRCMGDLHLAGVEIGTHVNGDNLDSPGVFAVLEAARDLDAAVFVHPWDMLGRERMERYMLPWLVGMPTETALAICSIILGGVLDRLPGLRIAFAHGGGAFPAIAGRVEQAYGSRPDLVAVDASQPPSHYLDRIWVDSLVHDDGALRRLLDLFGPERVMLGSDYPFPLGEDPPGSVLAAMTGVDAAVRSQVRGRNALAFLGLDRSRFVT
jgi:aminocarboxymuconate-semialdehyde decarboxylase